MSGYTRRDVLKVGAGVLGGAAFAGLAGGCEEGQMCKGKKWEGFKYSMCNESMKELSWERQCEIIGSAGYTGVEIAPFTLVEQGVEEISAEKRAEMVKVMKDAGIECVGLHWLLSPPPKGLHFTTADKQVRARTVGYLDSLIDFCGDMGGEVMIFGSPNQRSAKGMPVSEANKNFADGLAKVADHAKSRGVMILLEPLDKSQTDVVNTTAEAMEIVRAINHPNIKTMFDFHNTVDESLGFSDLIRKYYAHIYHVHVMEMDGRHLGTGTAVNDYVPAFKTLRELGYDRWVSLEVFDFTPGGERIANESMKVLKEIERKVRG